MSAMSSMRRRRADYIPDDLADELLAHFELAAARADRRRSLRAPALALLVAAASGAALPLLLALV